MTSYFNMFKNNLLRALLIKGIHLIFEQNINKIRITPILKTMYDFKFHHDFLYSLTFF